MLYALMALSKVLSRDWSVALIASKVLGATFSATLRKNCFDVSGPIARQGRSLLPRLPSTIVPLTVE